MMELIFFFLMFLVFGNIFKFALKASWAITKLLFTFIFLPFFLVGLVIKGLLILAFPILLVIFLFSLFL